MANAIDKLEYVWIPASTFTMDCSPGDAECNGSEQPPHEVRIANGFWLGQTLVTRSAWVTVMGRNLRHTKGGDLPEE
jgi:formylglycine-generating enzyme required for sulfatase activity